MNRISMTCGNCTEIIEVDKKLFCDIRYRIKKDGTRIGKVKVTKNKKGCGAFLNSCIYTTKP